MIISFAYTWAVLLAGRKTCTRRDWSRIQFERLVRAWDEGRLIHQAWSHLPFVEGAAKGPDIRLTCRPYLEPLCDMPESDLEAEGGLWATKQEFVELFGGDPSREVAVARFVPVVLHGGDGEWCPLNRTPQILRELERAGFAFGEARCLWVW
jgi:hypothetical protein